MKNLVLIGFMGTGKSTVGKILAKKLGYRFVDTDAEIERRAQKSISQIFETCGEEGFRDIETVVLCEFAQKKNTVIATGGGAVLRKENMDALRKNGVVILLRAQIETIAQRVAGNSNRPLANGQSVEELKERLQSRAVYYENHDFAFEVEDLSPMQIADRIIDIYKKL